MGRRSAGLTLALVLTTAAGGLLLRAGIELVKLSISRRRSLRVQRGASKPTGKGQ